MTTPSNFILATLLAVLATVTATAAPIPDPRVERTRAPRALRGEIPSPLTPPSGCVFHTRCPIADDHCRREVPAVRELKKEHFVACHKA